MRWIPEQLHGYHEIVIMLTLNYNGYTAVLDKKGL